MTIIAALHDALKFASHYAANAQEGCYFLVEGSNLLVRVYFCHYFIIVGLIAEGTEADQNYFIFCNRQGAIEGDTAILCLQVCAEQGDIAEGAIIAVDSCGLALPLQEGVKLLMGDAIEVNCCVHC